MSKNGNTSDIAGGACRIGLAVMTVSLAAMLTASTLHAEPFDQTSPVELIEALARTSMAPIPVSARTTPRAPAPREVSSSLPEATPYSRS